MAGILAPIAILGTIAPLLPPPEGYFRRGADALVVRELRQAA